MEEVNLKKQILKILLRDNGRMTFLLMIKKLKYFMENLVNSFKEKFYKMVSLMGMACINFRKTPFMKDK